MKLAHNYYVYVVQCSDAFYYTGITNDLERRIEEHNHGVNPTCYTFKRRPVVLKYFEHYTDVTQAIQREKQLKGWSKAKKEALFIQDFNSLRELAKCTANKVQSQVHKANAPTLRQAQGDNAQQASVDSEAD
jgi:putative endonuclease